MFKSKIELYTNVNKLDAISRDISDELARNRIRIAMIERIIEKNPNMFYLINKFIVSDGILKDAYADVILMKITDNDYELPNAIVNDVLNCASIDALMYYGAESLNLEFSKRCKEEFYERASLFEDKNELIKKKILDRKGEKDDKHKRKQ